MHFSPRGLSVKEGEVVNGLDSEDTHVAIGVVWKKTIGVRRRCGLCSLVGQQCFGLPRPPTFFGMVSKQQAARQAHQQRSPTQKHSRRHDRWPAETKCDVLRFF